MRRLRMSGPAWLLLGQALAFWPAWRWYGLRLADRSDQPFAVVAVLTVMLYVGRERLRRSADEHAGARLYPAFVLLAAYILAFRTMPPMILALLAIASVAWTAQAWLGRRIHPAAWGLVILSLPLLPSLDFYLGYPLRVATGMLARLLLAPAGFVIGLDGAALSWNGRLIAIDAPCCGLRMMWAGLYLTLTLACFTRQPWRRLIGSIMLAAVAVILGNALRAAALFLPEAGLVHLPPFGHEAVGVVIFSALAAACGGFILRGRRPAPCR